MKPHIHCQHINKNYMKQLHILVLALAFAQAGMAQTHEELVIDGGFEVYVTPQPTNNNDDEEGTSPSFDPYLKPQYWYFNSSLSRERTKTAHSGKYSIRVYPNGGSFIARDKDFNTHYIKVQPGAEYELSYWYQGTVTKPNILAYIDWHKGDKLVKKDERKAQKDLANGFSATWKKKTLTFKAPAGVETASLGFYIQSVYEDAEAGRYILIDDISLVKTKEGIVPNKPEPPANLHATPQQREVVLSWNAVAETDVAYEITIDGKTVATTQATKYVVTRLEPGKRYAFSVKTIKGSVASDASAPVSQTTLPLNFGIEEEDRIPYLYMVREQGTAPRTLPLYYHDLANPDAKILYWVDGQAVTPTSNTITFSSKGEHTLRIEIEETPTRKWEIEYKLNVD